MRNPVLIVPLAEATDARAVGGKAANLARLLALAVPVPDGFVITDEAFRFGHGVLPPDVDAAVGDAWRGLRAAPAIVRSSAVGEDSDAASFAGQLDSIAGVCDEGQLRDAIARVWASRWSDRVLAYQAARGTPLAGMGVIVQRQIDAALSGVLFTVSPQSGQHLLLEYCGGMGEALVSGQVNPGRVTIRRRGFAWSRDAAPDRATPGEGLLLNDAQIGSLARLALEIERAFGGPQDIEWTIDTSGRLWVVQSRPITVARRAGATAAPAGAGILWSNANVNENFPEPISPLLYSIASAGYYHYFRNLGRAFGVSERRLALMEQPLRHIIGVHGARMYYNLSSIHAVLRSAPFGDLLTASFNQFVGAGEVADRDVNGSFAARARGRVAQGIEVAIIAFKTARQYFFLTRRVERFEAAVTAFAERTRPDRLASRAPSELLDDLRGFLDIRCNRWNDAALADAASMVCYGLLQRLLARALPEADQSSLHNTLLKALPNLVSGKPALMLWELSREIRGDEELSRLFASSPPEQVLSALTSERFAAFDTAFRRYLDEWGFRCSAELMLTTPSFQESPAPVIDLLKAYAAIDGPSPEEQLKRQESERLAETLRVGRAVRERGLLASVALGPAVSLVLAWTQRAIQLRERARLKQALLYSRLRRIALAIGTRLVECGRLAHRDDVFFLTADEIDALLSGHAMFPGHVRGLVELRRQAHRELSATAPPDSMRLAVGEYLVESTGEAELKLPPATSGSILSGVGACGGTVTGRAVVLGGVGESEKIAPGDVLITRQTDPGWGPIFPLISGLVIERGGMLSHGAIIAREFGIPSVVGVRDATRHVADGSRITVDGDRGLVHLHAEAQPC